MKTLIAISTLILVSVTVNAQDPATKLNNLSVRRKSKENRLGKLLLTNVPSRTTSPLGKSTALASRLVLTDGSSVIPDRRKKRDANLANRRLSEQGLIKYLLRSRQL